MNKILFLLLSVSILFWSFTAVADAQGPSYEVCPGITEHTITHTMPYDDGTMSDLWVDIVGPLRKDGQPAYEIIDITSGWDSPVGQVKETTLHWNVSELSTYLPVISYTLSITGNGLPASQTRFVHVRGWYTGNQYGLEKQVVLWFTCTRPGPISLPLIFH